MQDNVQRLDMVSSQYPVKVRMAFKTVKQSSVKIHNWRISSIYRHDDLYIYMIFLQKSFLFIRNEEELGKKKKQKTKKKLFWRYPSKTGMKYKFNQSNFIFILVVECSFVLESLKALSIGSYLIIPTTIIPIGRLEMKSNHQFLRETNCHPCATDFKDAKHCYNRY